MKSGPRPLDRFPPPQGRGGKATPARSLDSFAPQERGGKASPARSIDSLSPQGRGGKAAPARSIDSLAPQGRRGKAAPARSINSLSPGERVRVRGNRRQRGLFRSPPVLLNMPNPSLVNVLRGLAAAPLAIPAAPHGNRCFALRSPPDPQPAVGLTRRPGSTNLCPPSLAASPCLPASGSPISAGTQYPR